ncbi:Maf family protein [Kamptonema cortianum]|nr:Maf family protein [Kamptonema cortianum]
MASASPRRSDLLSELGIEFIVIPASVDEDALTEADPWQTARKLAREKALSVYSANPDSIVIGGDTVVAFKENESWKQLTKPVDEDDAVRILTTLSGRTHTVITGVCVKWPSGFSSFTDESEVTFRPMTRPEILAYVESGEPMDKAGAYGFQGGARPFVKEVRGSVNNVIGLPTERLQEVLREIESV